MSMYRAKKRQKTLSEKMLSEGGKWIGDDSCHARFDLSTQQKKTASILALSVQGLTEKFGIERISMLTLTFKDHVTCRKEASRRFNSLVSNVIKKRYHEYVGVIERQKSGRLHYHIVLVHDCDVRGNLDFEALKNRDYRSANDALRREWAFWRRTAPKYNFGRTELLPAKSTAKALAYYIGKYISKDIESRAIGKVCNKQNFDDKGARLVRYSNGARAGNTRFMFVSKGSELWRKKVALFAQIVSETTGSDVKSIDDLSSVCGKRWAYKNHEFICSLCPPDDGGSKSQSSEELRDEPDGDLLPQVKERIDGVVDIDSSDLPSDLPFLIFEETMCL